MKITLISTVVAMALASPLQAACYADYKAKRDNPLRLHYGVIELPDAACTAPEQAKTQITNRIAVDGWQLLNIVSVFEQAGLNERRESAGPYFLRY